MKRIPLAALVGASALFMAGVTASLAGAPAAAPTKATDLGNRTWMIEGSGGNMVVAVGDDGVILVDGQFANQHDRIMEIVKGVTDQKVKYVANTHYHGDHTGGNAGFWLDGATVVAQTNTGKYLGEGTTNALTGAKTAAVVKSGQPGQTYATATTLRVKGRTAQLTHMPAAHTGGDTSVYFADANVLVTGDIVSTGARYPNIDVGAGGNVKGMINAVNAYIRRANASTKVVPGHGALMNRAGLIEYRDMLVTCRDRVAKLISSGQTEDQAVAAKPLADIQAKLGANDMASDNFVRLIYKSLKA